MPRRGLDLEYRKGRESGESAPWGQSHRARPVADGHGRWARDRRSRFACVGGPFRRTYPDASGAEEAGGPSANTRPDTLRRARSRASLPPSVAKSRHNVARRYSSPLAATQASVATWRRVATGCRPEPPFAVPAWLRRWWQTVYSVIPRVTRSAGSRRSGALIGGRRRATQRFPLACPRPPAPYFEHSRRSHPSA